MLNWFNNQNLGFGSQYIFHYKESWNTLPDQNFPAARIAFAGYSIFGCGDAGKFQFYDFITEDKSKKMDAGDAFLNVIAVS